MTYRIRFHPAVADDITSIAELIASYAGPEAAERRLSEIEAVISSLAATPYKGSVRSEIAPGLRAIPAGRKAVIAFTVNEAGRWAPRPSVSRGTRPPSGANRMISRSRLC